MKKLVAHPNALIVDDDPVIVEMLNTALEITGLFDGIHKASSYQEGKSALKSINFGLIIFDNNLPDGKGFQLLHDLRHDLSNKNSQVPAIFTTVAITPEMERDLKSLPHTRFLPKPYVIENVVEIMVELLGLK
ncbi:MAG: response regulator [Bdellovibrio sp.]|nr:response regulator [Bdellovibrio sp.]